MSSELRHRWTKAGGTIPDSWKIVTLESLLKDSKSIAVGVMYPGPDTIGGTPLIKVGDIKGGQIPQKPMYCISQETNNEHKRTQLVGDELLITLVGNPGECVVVTPAMAGWNPARAIAVIRLSDPELRIYLKTVLESAAGKHLIDAVLNTTVQKTLNLKDVRQLPIPMPPRESIRSISAFSEALSNRINLLRETNATLEAIAQAMFKSWFVDFDPVHANAGTQAPSLPPEIQALFPATFTGSPQGPIPDGWSSGSLGHVAETSRKQLKPEQMSSETLYVGLEHIPRKQLGLDTWGTAEELASTKSAFERNDILFGKLRPYFHKVVIAPIDGVCSTDILVCKSKQANYHYYVALHLFSDELITYADRLSNGAKMPRIGWKDLAAYEVVIPPNEIAEEFQSLVEPMINRILANVEQAKTLSSLRDTLLPRLISGQLHLSAAKTALAEVG